MQPYLIRVGGFSLASYPFLYGLGIAMAGLVTAVLLRARGVSLARSANMFVLGAAAVVIGGQIMYAIVRWDNVKDDVGSFVTLSGGGQILYGSILLAAPTLWVVSRLLGLAWREVLDAAAVGAPLGLVFGRMGCFCKGCCHGGVTDFALGVSYPKVIDVSGALVGSEAFVRHVHEQLIPASAAGSLPVHPVQLYEACASLVLFGVLLILWARGIAKGRLAPLFLMYYCVVRFCLEFIRVQEKVLTSLTLAQIISIVIGALSVWLFVFAGPGSRSGRRTWSCRQRRLVRQDG